MQFQRVVGVGQASDRATQQLALDVEQRHPPALGEKSLWPSQARCRARRR